jgi:tRNA(fMet)-specific endonuclease VapC
MKAFDADVLTLILQGDAACVHKPSLIPSLEQGIPVVVIEEILRGRSNVIRQAQAEKSKLSIDRAYRLLELAISDFQNIKVLSHTSDAEILVKGWRKQKIRIGNSDLRIAAICVIHSATLISRNRKDFEQGPGLSVSTSPASNLRFCFRFPLRLLAEHHRPSRWRLLQSATTVKHYFAFGATIAPAVGGKVVAESFPNTVRSKY